MDRRHFMTDDLAPLCGDWSSPGPGVRYVLTPVLDDVTCVHCYETAATVLSAAAAARRRARLRAFLRWLSPVPCVSVAHRSPR